jgi:type I restriction enzyme R subunit
VQKQKVGSQARAMVVTGSIQRAIAYWQAMKGVLAERKSHVKLIIAFSGEQLVDGQMVTEAKLNGFPSKLIPETFKADPYRILVVADKFQTGFDEPLLHTMYVDKPLSSVKAVQTLSRLNRAHPAKSDTFVLDFFNDADDIERAFQPYYRTTILSGESDPNKLHDQQGLLDDAGVYSEEEVAEFVQRYLSGEDIALLHPILDACRDRYDHDLDDEQKIAFKGTAKAFVRTYAFLSAILPYTNAEWEQRSIFLKFLVPKLPAPDDPDLARGILEAIDMESYRVEAQATMEIALEDTDGPVEPPPVGDPGFKPEPELDRLSNILQNFNDLFADAGFSEADRIHAMNNINGPIMQSIASDGALAATMASGDEQNSQIQFNSTLAKAWMENIGSNLQVYKKQQQDPLFRQHLEALVYSMYKASQTFG